MILRFASGSATPGERVEEARLGIDADDAHAEMLGEGAHDLVAFAEAQQAVIDEHAHELIADGAVQQGGDHRGIDAAGQPQQHLARADLRAHALDRVLDDVADAPQRVAAADLAHEALQQPRALRRVRDFGMELHAVEAAPLVAPWRRTEWCRSRRWRRNPAAARRPDRRGSSTHRARRGPARRGGPRGRSSSRRGAGHGHLGVAELALGGRRHAAAELLRHGLHAVADAEHRHAELEHRLRRASAAARR